jgi:pseudouridine-5'-phosphate glycosidase
MKNNVLAVIGGTIALFGLGYLIYVLGGFEFQKATKEELDLPHIILMEVLYATLLTIIFAKWAGIKTFATGAKAGLIIGALIGGCATLHTFATTDLTDLTGVITGIVTFGVRFAVAGGVIGWMLGRE